MSLLEDVFLEDEAGEAQELERVIEGDEYDERPLSPNSDNNEEKDDEAEEDKRRVDPTQAKTKRVVKNPRFILNPARLTGPRGIQVIPDHFKDFKFKGKGHEKEDLDMVLKKLEHWAYRLYPKFDFHDCLKKIETLGKKKVVMVHLSKIRSDQLVSDEAVVQKDSSDDEAPEAPVQEDEFDKLLQQQIELARATPAPGSVKKTAFSTPGVDRSIMMPKATSSPSISDEQRERMLRNRQLAEERRLAKLSKEKTANETDKENNHEVIEAESVNVISEDVITRKHNRSQIIDSSDDEDSTVNQSVPVPVDIHKIVDDEMSNDNDKGPAHVTCEIDDEIKTRKHRKFNSIDSSDDDELHIDEDVELHNELNDGSQPNSPEATRPDSGVSNKQVFHKDYRSNDLGSDEEIEEIAVHNTNNVKINKKINSEDLSSLNSDADKVTNDKVNPEVHKDQKLNSSESPEIMSKSNRASESYEANIDLSHKINNDSNSLNNKKLQETSNHENNEVIDDVMDVDFSEDF